MLRTALMRELMTSLHRYVLFPSFIPRVSLDAFNVSNCCLQKCTLLNFSYWCTKCKKRFGSQAKLVDHMSYSVEHNYKVDKKRKSSSGSMGSNQPSPASSESSMSSHSPGSVSPFNDIMSVLSP